MFKLKRKNLEIVFIFVLGYFFRFIRLFGLCFFFMRGIIENIVRNFGICLGELIREVNYL